MLSKTERDYLLGTISPSHAHKRVLDHRINKKLKEFFRLELPLIHNSSVTDFRNNVTEFSNDIFHDEEKLKVRKGVEPLCISFAGSRITVLPPHHFKKHKMNN